jgi:hypothetical protein
LQWLKGSWRLSGHCAPRPSQSSVCNEVRFPELGPHCISSEGNHADLFLKFLLHGPDQPVPLLRTICRDSGIDLHLVNEHLGNLHVVKMVVIGQEISLHYLPVRLYYFLKILRPWQ